MFNSNKIKIGIFDSGVGGLSVLKDVISCCDYDEIYYLGDNVNTPYGNKSYAELFLLAIKGVNKLISYGANVIVLACNTLSLNVITHLARIFNGVKFFGVFPPIESAVINGDDYLVLATCSSVNALRKNYPNINALALPDLAYDIENNIYNLENVNLSKHVYGIKNSYGKIILGCTHYHFIEDEFKKYFIGANVVSGNINTVKNLQKFINTTVPDHHGERKKVVFIGDFRGKNSRIFGKIYSKF